MVYFAVARVGVICQGATAAALADLWCIKSQPVLQRPCTTCKQLQSFSHRDDCLIEGIYTLGCKYTYVLASRTYA